MNGDRSIVFVLPKALDCIQKANLRQPCVETVRHVIKSIKGATTDYRSRFSNTPKKICCVRIPRAIFSQDLLEQLDAGKRFYLFDTHKLNAYVLCEYIAVTIVTYYGHHLFFPLAFGKEPEPNTTNDDDDDDDENVDQPTQCGLCEVKDKTMEDMKDSYKSRLEKVELWYEEQAEKQKETFLKRLQEQKEEIDALLDENKKLKAMNEELNKATEFPPDTATQVGSIVTQAISSIIGKF